MRGLESHRGWACSVHSSLGISLEEREKPFPRQPASEVTPDLSRVISPLFTALPGTHCDRLRDATGNLSSLCSVVINRSIRREFTSRVVHLALRSAPAPRTPHVTCASHRKCFSCSV